MTRDEFEALLEEAFKEGYDSALEEILEEDSSYDLEEEMDAYEYMNESSAAARARKREILARNLEVNPTYEKMIQKDKRWIKSADFKAPNAKTRYDREYYHLDHRGRELGAKEGDDHEMHEWLKDKIKTMKSGRAKPRDINAFSSLTNKRRTDRGDFIGKKMIRPGAARSEKTDNWYKNIAKKYS